MHCEGDSILWDLFVNTSKRGTHRCFWEGQRDPSYVAWIKSLLNGFIICFLEITCKQRCLAYKQTSSFQKNMHLVVDNNKLSRGFCCCSCVLMYLKWHPVFCSSVLRIWNNSISNLTWLRIRKSKVCWTGFCNTFPPLAVCAGWKQTDWIQYNTDQCVQIPATVLGNRCEKWDS